MTSILLVEDDAEMISLLTRFLPEEGYEVRVVSDMAATLRAVSEREPDLILLDIVLGKEYSAVIYLTVSNWDRRTKSLRSDSAKVNLLNKLKREATVVI